MSTVKEQQKPAERVSVVALCYLDKSKHPLGQVRVNPSGELGRVDVSFFDKDKNLAVASVSRSGLTIGVEVEYLDIIANTLNNIGFKWDIKGRTALIVPILPGKIGDRVDHYAPEDREAIGEAFRQSMGDFAYQKFMEVG